jgi:hypothetical protein
MWNGTEACFPTTAATLLAVPTGTVDLVMITASLFRCFATVSAAASTWRRSAEPSSSGGVPTARKTTCAVAAAVGTSVVNERRPCS